MKMLVHLGGLMPVANVARKTKVARKPVNMSRVPVGESAFDEESGLVAFQKTQLATLNAIASLTAHKKAIEEQEKTMKAALYDAMQKFGIKKFESDVLNLTLVAPSNSTAIDSAKLKKKYPAIAAECSKPNPKAGYVKITLKGGGADAKG